MPDFPAQFDVAVLDGSNGFRLIGGGTYDNGGSGYIVAGLGDINGDGFDDVAVVAPFAEGWSQYTIGTVNVFEGRAAPGADFYLWDGGPAYMGRYEEEFGQRVAGLGDINGDGFADFMIEGAGSYYQIDVTDPYSYVWVGVPHTYVIYGGGDHVTSGTTSDYAGFAAAGDVNGDGFGDVTVGNSTIVFGSASGIPDEVRPADINATTGLKLAGATIRAVGAAGDVNGDGFDDVLARDDADNAYIVFGRAAGGSVDVSQLDGADGFLLDVPVGDLNEAIGLGDVNGDGLDDVALDVIIQGPQAQPLIYVVFGRSDGVASLDASALDGSNGFSVQGGNTMVAAAGDINGDTLADLIVTGHYVIFGRSGDGPVSIHVGTLNGSNGFEILAADARDVEGAGDVNGDGIDDLMVGTPWYADPLSPDWTPGVTHVIYGQVGAAQDWTGTDGDDFHTGSGADDVLSGLGGKDHLRGAGGNDLLIGGAGGDILDGGEGEDTASFAAATRGVVVDLVAGTATGPGLGNDTLASIEHVVGTGGADDISGTAGDNRLDGRLGADRLVGRAGNDTYVVDNAGDVVVETRNQGIDTVETTLATYTLGADVENLDFIGTGNFKATGNTLANIILGGDGNDDLNGGRGQDTLRGGLGNDTYVVDHHGDVVDETGGGGTDTIETTLNYTLAGEIENLVLRGTGAISGTGNALANVMTGNAGNNTLIGLEGNDTLTGGDGDDKMLGGDGNDTLSGGISDYGDHDLLRGGLGDDTYLVFDGNDVVSEADGGGIDTVKITGVSSYTLGSGVENLLAQSVYGGVLTGNSLNNTIIASARGFDDTLNGMRGDDVLSGRGGVDTFVFGTGFGHDRITDFAAEDKIRFEGGLFADFADVMAHAAQVGTQVVITWNAGNSVTLSGYQMASLVADDFLFA